VSRPHSSWRNYGIGAIAGACLLFVLAGAVYLGEVGSNFNGGYSTTEIAVFGVLLLLVGIAVTLASGD
jgi:formate-dependent nitrite reductase membrane component NrfD